MALDWRRLIHVSDCFLEERYGYNILPGWEDNNIAEIYREYRNTYPTQEDAVKRFLKHELVWSHLYEGCDHKVGRIHELTSQEADMVLVGSLMQFDLPFLQTFEAKFNKQ